MYVTETLESVKSRYIEIVVSHGGFDQLGDQQRSTKLAKK